MVGKKVKNRDTEILHKLEEWRQKDGSLPQFVELYEQLLRLQIEVKSAAAVPEPALSPQTAANRLRQGLPLLEFDDLLLDWNLVQSQFYAILDTITSHLTEEVEEVQSLRQLAANIPLLQQVTSNWYQLLSLSSLTTALCVDEKLLSTVIQTALRPFLTAHSETWHILVDQDLWRRRSCPLCGGKPDFAFLDRERGARWLLCTRCDTEWLFQRLECPYCGTRDKDDLAYLTGDQEVYRLYTCEKCRHYIKAIDLRKVDDNVLLPLERILTVDMDRQGAEAGYRAG